MKRRKFGLMAAVSAAAMGAGIGSPKRARAAVTQAQADLLKTTLTPMGAERAANADGSIPAWTGGATQVPAGWSSPALMPDLFPDEQPLVTINSGNMAQYADKVPESVKWMMQNQGFSIIVYPTHRTAAAPQWVYDNIYQNALTAQPAAGGARLGFSNTYGGVPFPIPSSDPAEAGAEIIQNHNFRWNGEHQIYNNSTYAVSHGQVTMVLQDNYAEYYNYYQQNGRANFNGVITGQGMFFPVGPANAIGANVIADDSMNNLKFPRSGWELLTGQGRVRRIPEIQYDVPDSNIDGITNYDESFMWGGSLDEFDWKLIGKKEMYIPYNTNKINFMSLSDLQQNFFAPTTNRWELHRVWVVECTLHPGKRNVVPHRRFYVDEDTWIIAALDEYDSAGNLWKGSQAYLIARPDIPGTILEMYVTYNYQSQSYTASFMPDLSIPPSQRTQDFVTVPPQSDFNPQDMAARSSF